MAEFENSICISDGISNEFVIIPKEKLTAIQMSFTSVLIYTKDQKDPFTYIGEDAGEIFEYISNHMTAVPLDEEGKIRFSPFQLM